MQFRVLRPVILRFLVVSLMIFYPACASVPTFQPTSSPIPLAKELVLYDWEEDMPQSVLDAFTHEYGLQVKYMIYDSQEEAIANIRAGEVYDVVVMESRFIPLLVQEGLLASLHKDILPNLKNVSANFRELAYDPSNEYSIPYNWGTTGLVVRSDLVDEPVTRWADLWDTRYAGRVGIWLGQHREVISLTLKSLGYSANSEDPGELEDALLCLIKLKQNIIVLEDFDLATSAGLTTSGQVIISMGYAYDLTSARERNPATVYVLPREGALLWNDTFVIPINSPNQYTAELFLNFLMRPDINALIVNENHYATPNEAAHPFIEPDILNNRVIFPSNEDLANAELILPLSPPGQKLYE
jgi:spermidine/putrescine transport system substrate-binding protein